MNGVIIQVGTEAPSKERILGGMIGNGGNCCLGLSPETAGDSLFNIPRLVSRNMYYRTVVASALIRLLRLVTLARFNDALVFAMLETTDRYDLSRFCRRASLAYNTGI